MPSETIIIRFSSEVDGSRELATVAAGLAFDFSTSFADRPAGVTRGVSYRYRGHYWCVWWTRARAVVVQCLRREV